MDKPLNLQQKIVEIRKSIDAFSKDTKGYGYSYVSGTQVLKKIRDKMDELGLLLYPSVLDQNHEPYEYKTNKGQTKDLLVYGKMTYTWLNAEKPEETMEIPWQYMGQQDDFSQAFGSALTYSERYFLLKFFGVPTDDDDPDARKGNRYQNQNNNSYQKNNNQNQSHNNNQQKNNGQKASENQLKALGTLTNRMVKEKKLTIDTVLDTLEKKKDADGKILIGPFGRDIKNMTMQQASAAIGILKTILG